MKLFYQSLSPNNGKKFKLCLILALLFALKNKKLKIGVIGLPHNDNIGNNLVKYSISIKLLELGFIHYILYILLYIYF